MRQQRGVVLHEALLYTFSVVMDMVPSTDSVRRIRDLPENERDEFRQWLRGAQVPLVPGVPTTEQDGYYQHDYDFWKRKK